MPTTPQKIQSGRRNNSGMTEKSPKYNAEKIEAARIAWIHGESVASIAKRLNINSRRVIYRWREKYKWDQYKNPRSALESTTIRYNLLIDQAKKTEGDWDEIERLSHLIVRFDREDKREEAGAGRPAGVKNGQSKRKKKLKKNQIDHLTEEDFKQLEDKLFYEHQKQWLAAGEDELTKRIRFILKSRQIGATYVFGYEAFKTAVLKGHNQIFISSTKAQAAVFKSYISIIAREHFDIEIAGNPVTLSNGAELHFISPNGFADSRSGDVYFDEVFKTKKFKEMEAIAAPMATLSKFKKTYFSSPTAISHDAYEIWDGSRYTRHHPKIEIDVSDHKALVNGRLDADGIWRCVCTVHDAIALGWDQVDLEQLRLETPDPDLFKVVYECEFMDDSNSVFKLNDILACGVDVETWTDYDSNAPYPIGNLPCSAGYDPAGKGDNASFVILTKPLSIEEKFRLVSKDVWKGLSAPYQTKAIARRSQQFNLEDIEIDNTGPGELVGDYIEEIHPNVRRITYSPVIKTRMVQKAQSVIQAGRFEYDENDDVLPLAFLTVYQTMSKTGVITYASSHHKSAGHGDEAWATMHAMMCEPFNPATGSGYSMSVFH